MKKLLLILICLFVSFEVKSKEKILHCKIYYESEDSLEPLKSKENFFYHEIHVFLDVENKWLSSVRQSSKVYKELLLPKMRDKSWEDNEFYYQSIYKVDYDEDRYIEYSFQLNKFSGYFKFMTQERTKPKSGYPIGAIVNYMSNGECEHIKRKKF